MSDPLHTVTALPEARRPGCPFDPPEELLRAREHGPISRYAFPDGHQGWLVTGYDLVRSVLADPRFSSRKELMRHHPLIDYGDIKRAVDPIVKRLDHYYLNEIEGLANPTSEVIAKWLWDRIKPSLPLLATIIVHETCSSSCEFRGDG